MRSISARYAMFFTAICAAALPAMACSAAAGDETMANTNEAIGPVLDPLPTKLAAPPPAPTQWYFPPRSWGNQLTLKNGGWTPTLYPRVFADVNGDGKKDLVGFGNDGVWTALSTGNGYFNDAHYVLNEYGLSKGWSVDRHIRTMGDVNGDGMEDIVAFGDLGVSVSVALVGGGFGPSALLADYGYNQGWRIDQHVRVLADINHDGRKDVVGFGYYGVTFALGQANGSFGPATNGFSDAGTISGWSNAKHIRTMADINGDGMDDVVAFGDAGVYTALSTGSGFGPFRQGSGEFGYNQLWRLPDMPRVLADINKDGKKDILGFAASGVTTALSNGNGTFGTPKFSLYSFGDSGEGWPPIAWNAKTPRFVDDINHDGYADIVGVYSDGEIYRSLGSATGFGVSTKMSADWWKVGDVSQMTLADVDGNGMDDLVSFSDTDIIVETSNGTP